MALGGGVRASLGHGEPTADQAFNVVIGVFRVGRNRAF